MPSSDRDFKESKHRNTEIEVLKAAIRSQLDKLIRLNKTRLNFAEKFEELIESYNAGSRNIEELFEELVKLSRSLSEEEQRHVRENLTEEELVIFDILTRPAPELSSELAISLLSPSGGRQQVRSMGPGAHGQFLRHPPQRPDRLAPQPPDQPALQRPNIEPILFGEGVCTQTALLISGNPLLPLAERSTLGNGPGTRLILHAAALAAAGRVSLEVVHLTLTIGL
jgi:Type I restriction enzyme HindI endonuclease subunit-like, C-terminal